MSSQNPIRTRISRRGFLAICALVLGGGGLGGLAGSALSADSAWVAEAVGPPETIRTESPARQDEPTMHITVNASGQAIVFELNDSGATRSLLAQLPLSTDVENYGGIEKILYPPKKLDVTGMSPARICPSGTLAYYAPWGNVVLFYGDFGSASGLYELGHAVLGGEHIRSLSGTIRVKVGDSR